MGAAVDGGTQIAANDTTVPALHERLVAAEPQFRATVVGPVTEGRAADTFVDATCLPPQTFSLGGVLAVTPCDGTLLTYLFGTVMPY